MAAISLKLSAILLREVEHEAAARGVPKSAVIRDCIERTLRKGGRTKRMVSCLDLAADLVGSQPGPADASTNRRYLEEGVVTDRARGRKNRR